MAGERKSSIVPVESRGDDVLRVYDTNVRKMSVMNTDLAVCFLVRFININDLKSLTSLAFQLTGACRSKIIMLEALPTVSIT